ncbi:CMC4 (YMR194C-B) [Zygosaccharomyces parabailii]|nr:CMC4 (YMR194C-B) [Zygosaccharomyces parabailii]
MAKTTPPCKPQACAIQNCLLSNDYNEAKCDHLVDDLYRCCQRFYQDTKGQERTPCCPQPDLLKLKMSQRRLD